MTSEDGRYPDFVYVVVKTIVGNNEIRKTKFKVYPNPVSGNVLNIEWADSSEKIIWSLYSVNGALVSKNKMRMQDLSEINVGNIEPGIYVLNIKSNFGIYNQKIIKQ